MIVVIVIIIPGVYVGVIMEFEVVLVVLSRRWETELFQ